VPINSTDSFNVYVKGTVENKLKFLLLHGAGYSGLTWACFGVRFIYMFMFHLFVCYRKNYANCLIANYLHPICVVTVIRIHRMMKIYRLRHKSGLCCCYHIVQFKCEHDLVTSFHLYNTYSHQRRILHQHYLLLVIGVCVCTISF
jgi:hypothetical protein